MGIPIPRFAKYQTVKEIAIDKIRLKTLSNQDENKLYIKPTNFEAIACAVIVRELVWETATFADKSCQFADYDLEKGVHSLIKTSIILTRH